MRTIRILATLLALGAPTFATPVYWSFSGAVYDGGSVTGSFVFDADTAAYSDINVSSSEGITYNFLHPTVSSNENRLLLLETDAGDLTGVFSLEAFFSSPLSNTGGTIPLSLSPGGGSRVETCTNATCTTIDTIRSMTAGEVVSGVPAPASLGLAGAGLLAMAAFRLRARRACGQV